MKKIFTWLLLTVSLSASLPALAQNFAISLDGATNSVTTAAQIVPAGADFTVEFWAYVPSLVGGLHEFVSQGTTGGGFYIGYDGSTGNIRAGDNWQNTGVPVPIGRWFHLALTFFNATTTATLYIDDVIGNSNPGYSIVGGGTNFAIGVQFNGAEFMQAEMDELRVWNVARTQASIKASMFRGASSLDPTFSQVIAYYQMNENGGTTLTNSSTTTGLDGTVNGATWVSSPIQFALNGLSFDGVDAKVVVPPNALWDGLSQATIELNANPATLAGFVDMVGVRGAGGAKFNFDINNSAVGMYNGGAFFAVGATLNAGTWYHLSFVVDGVQDTTGVFVDGNYIGQIPFSFGATTGQPLVMGVSQNPGSDGEQYTGSLDDVRIWNTMLSQAQIQANMSNEMIGNEAGLVAEYTFDQGNAGGNNNFLTTAYDNTSGNNHGTLMNFTLSGGTTANFVTGASITPLPVNFTSFSATNTGKVALLLWQTAQEQNSRDFTIERSPNGSYNSWTAIGTLPAAGNSSVALNYSFRDVSPLSGINYYRLTETDLDGHSMFSPIRSLKFNYRGPDYEWHSTGNKALEFDLFGATNEWYTVTDMLGRPIQQGQLSFGKMYLNNVPTGVYSIRILSTNGAQRTVNVLVK
jgi:Concanavalin A-like lectin/glucanases superfamily